MQTSDSSNKSDEVIDQLCDEFEQAWQSGDTPEIEHYLTRHESTSVGLSSLFNELLALDIDYRHRTKDARTVSDYVARFPEYKEIILPRFADFDVEPTISHRSAAPQPPRELGNQPKGGEKPSPPPPASVGRYELQERVGAGSFGEVWRAYDPELDRTVAVKLPLSATPLSDSLLSQFKAEARRVSQLKSSGLVQIYDIGQSGGRTFIVSEYVSGGTLKNQVQAGQIDPKQAVQWLIEIADALHLLHLNHIVHRDLKPANVLLDENNHARVTDFGLAATEHEQLMERARICGTLNYMSPEQASGDSHHTDARADIYSLGVMMYELLTGRLPYILPDDDFEKLDTIIQKPPRPLRTVDDSISKQLEQICLSCLAKNVGDRPTTAADVSKQLKIWLRSVGGRPIARQRLAIIAGAAALATSAGAAIYMAWPGIPANEPKPRPPEGKHAWQERFGSVPTEIKWPGQRGEVSFSINPAAQNRLEVTAINTVALIQLGKLGTREFNVQLDILPQDDYVRHGLFFSYQELPVLDRIASQFHLLEFINSSSRDSTVGQFRKVSIQPSTANLSNFGLSSKTDIPRLRSVRRLSVSGDSARIASLKYGTRHQVENGDSDYSHLYHDFEKNSSHDAVELSGIWGILVDRGTTWFSLV